MMLYLTNKIAEIWRYPLISFVATAFLSMGNHHDSKSYLKNYTFMIVLKDYSFKIFLVWLIELSSIRHTQVFIKEHYIFKWLFFFKNRIRLNFFTDWPSTYKVIKISSIFFFFINEKEVVLLRFLLLWKKITLEIANYQRSKKLFF